MCVAVVKLREIYLFLNIEHDKGSRGLLIRVKGVQAKENIWFSYTDYLFKPN